MPELPEVEVVTSGLRNLLIGHKVLEVDSNWPRGFPNSEATVKEFLIGAKVTGVRRRGKIALIDLSSDYTMAIHLKMTGQLVYVKRKSKSQNGSFGGGHPTDSLIGNLPDKTTRIEFTLDKRAKLFFNDVRKFGWVRLLPTALLNQSDFISKLGPDALIVTADEFCRLIASRKKSIKACLLDQTIVSGCGNIYADESLWFSKLDPRTPATDISKVSLRTLHSNLQATLKLSIDNGATSSKNYVNAEGARGDYQNIAKVYQLTDQPCKRCRTPIKRIVVASRGTHVCPNCQRI